MLKPKLLVLGVILLVLCLLVIQHNMIAKLPTFYHSAIIKSQRDWQKSLEMLSSLVPKTSVANNSVYTAKGLVSEIQHKPGFSMSSKGLNESASGADQFLSQKDISKVSSVSASLLSNSLHARSSSSDALASPGAENLTMSQDNVDHHMTTYSNLRHNQTGYQSPEEHALNCSTIYQDTSVPSKLVVLWTPFWHHWEYWDKVMRGATNLKQRRCPVWRCEFVWSKEDSVRRVEDADAIVFFSLDLFSRDLPNRHAHQLWIWLEFEAPPISTFGTEAWASAEEKGIFFNMTMSYHHLNDIITSDTALMPLEMPQDCPLLEGDRMDTNSLTYTYYKAHLRDYDTVVQKHERDINNWIFSFSKENISEINEKYDKQKDKLLLSLTREEITWATRRKLTVWMASNCQTDSKREKLVEVLQNYINVTTVGKCGTQKCGKNHHDTYCYRWLAGSHQFYLSFENAVCDDYYSEKLWRPMEYGMVPVVYGGAKYKDILPTGSYIDVHSFPSPGKLAEHLIYLSKNPVAYLRHLRWRRFWRVREPIPWYCKVCSALHRTNKKSRKVLLDEWWNKTAKCYQSIL